MPRLSAGGPLQLDSMHRPADTAAPLSTATAGVPEMHRRPYSKGPSFFEALSIDVSPSMQFHKPTPTIAHTA